MLFYQRVAVSFREGSYARCALAESPLCSRRIGARRSGIHGSMGRERLSSRGFFFEERKIWMYRWSLQKWISKNNDVGYIWELENVEVNT